MVQVATRSAENGEAIEAEFTKVDSVPLVQRWEFSCGHDPRVPSSEDELTLGEGASRVDATALGSGFADLHLADPQSR